MMKAAYSDVKEKGMAIRGSARLHGVPESTLRWRLTKSDEDVKRGGPTFFTRAQEQMLAEHCVSMAHLGYGFTRWQVLEMAKNMSDAIGKPCELTKHWFYGFLRRFPDLKMTHPKKREQARDAAVSEKMLENYFTELNNTLDKYDLKNKPEMIWNVDETGISLEHNPPKVLAKAGSNPHCVTSGKSPTTTVIAAVSALGETIPPYVIFKGERMSKDIKTDGLPGTEYRSSPTGWSNATLFLDFFKNHFLHHVKTRPCILLYDGHSTHVTFDIIETARKENVHLFVLPPHSSHCLQPLDVSVFSPFKKSISTECHKFLHCHPDRVIVKEDLPKIIGSAFQASLTVSTIMSGYRKTGIFPFNPSAPVVSMPVVEKNEQKSKITRTERQDNRHIKILFEEKVNNFDKLKQSVEKPKKSTFVPPYGATITEETYYTKKKAMEEEKKEKLQKAQIAEKNSQCGKQKNIKRKLTFTPPFSDISCHTALANEENKENKTEKKGKGPLRNSSRGKGPAKKAKKSKTSHEKLGEIEDSDCCVVCNKFQPDALDLDKSIKFVEWGCCALCGKWVHLKFCCEVESLSERDQFVCPVCKI